MKRGERPPPGLREMVLRLAGRDPRPTNEVIRQSVEENFDVTVAVKTIRRYCKAAGLPTRREARGTEPEGATLVKLPMDLLLTKAMERHLERMVEAAGQFRRQLHNPHLELEPYIGTGQPLLLGGHDWALMPEEWVELTTPDFSDEALWGDTFPHFRQHLEGRSPFWKHLDELKEMAEKLAKDLDEAAGEFGKSDPGFWESWQKIQQGRSWRTAVSRTAYNPVPDRSQVRPPYGDGYADRVCRALAGGLLPDLYKRLWALVKKLAELNRDLAPHEVDRLLSAGARACDYRKDLANRKS